VIVEHVRPEIDAGRFPIKRTLGERVHVTADIFADGHDVVAAVLRDRPTSTAESAKSAENVLFSASSATAKPKLAGREESDAPAKPKLAGREESEGWRETPMLLVAPGSDEWTASFDTAQMGWHEYQIVAWVDRFETWRRDVKAKAAADQDVSLELLEGSLLVREAASRAERLGAAADAHWLLERTTHSATRHRSTNA
jgi:starch synthase (maltosyl-transferring)